MSTRVRQALQGAAGAAGGEALNVENVFSTYLYDGTSAEQSITNNIDLSGEGGSLWIKNRNNAGANHHWFNTENGRALNLMPNQNYAGQTSTATQDLKSFNSDGFTLNATPYNTNINVNGYNYVSWTFRKAPKFFDVVTYTGNGTAGREIAHNLGSVPGFIIVKKTNNSGDWVIQHRSLGAQGSGNIRLNSTDAAISNGQHYWGNGTVGINPTSSVFTVDNHTWVNNSGDNYVAYLFAHNDGDGGFGPTGDQDIIKCGSYTGSGNGEYNDLGAEVNLGFEPQWILIKPATWSSGSWQIYDTMRGINARTSTTDRDNATDAQLIANSTNAETGYRGLRVTPTGFKLETDSYDVNASIHDYIYVAIRRGPMAVPESATDVFTPLLGLTSSSAPPIYQASHTIDMVIEQPRFGDSAVIIDRLRGNRLLKTAATNAEAGNASYTMDYQTGAFNRYSGQSTWYVGQCFRRAPSFFDVVTYTGTGANRTVDHSLGVAPEMMWIKQRNASKDWCVYHSIYAGTNDFLYLNYTNGTINYGNFPWNSTAPTSSVFSLSNNGLVNALNQTYVAYLFASLDGISKVGSYTGNGTSQTIDCGFSSGARFVLIKRVTSAGANWYVFDTERGIVAGNDPVLYLNQTQAEWSGDDYIDPDNSGFQVTGDANGVNDNGDTFIFYAIA